MVAGVVVNVNGSVTVNESSNIQSAGAGARWGLGQYTSPGRMFVVGGYRFFQLNESLSIISRSSLGLPPFTAQPNVTVFDYYSTSNNFNGGDVGLAGEYHFRNRFWFGGETRLAMGNMQETLKIDGVVAAAASGFTASLPNGLLAQPTNMGTFVQNHFALIPSVDLKVGYHLTPGFRLTIGYNFTYITRVIRPAHRSTRRLTRRKLRDCHWSARPIPRPSSTREACGCKASRPASTCRSSLSLLRGFFESIGHREHRAHRVLSICVYLRNPRIAGGHKKNRGRLLRERPRFLNPTSRRLRRWSRCEKNGGQAVLSTAGLGPRFTRYGLAPPTESKARGLARIAWSLIANYIGRIGRRVWRNFRFFSAAPAG